MTTAAQRSPGRTRSTASRLAILNATLKLLETQPLQDVSIEAIAREAGVGKATIYRWWSTKAAVVIEAFLINHVSHVAAPRGMKPREALTQILQLLIKEYAGREGRIVSQIIAEGQSDPDVLREFRERFWYGRRAMALELVNEARRLGEFRDDIPAEFQLDQLFAPVYFQLLTAHSPLTQEFANAHCDNVMRLMAPVARQTQTKPKSR
ncbi:TetR/AcrR family transcriptional regulator [Paraburkholderia sp. MM5384-R2]|uniref:TetR/AcrR family transcriptional regulator n=1 Tax=Paraburkholderia sp. MM5384-R2 TaxID=2723097 RepID=UPI00160C1C44|nr:TetR/AcrR family transcriptional regulator [Paraburkholderia sp. MM5384-R2]MBB5497593.1 AcrR family transcriptional regulator [Paraburkholderia sp. MM5384-R2]